MEWRLEQRCEPESNMPGRLGIGQFACMTLRLSLPSIWQGGIPGDGGYAGLRLYRGLACHVHRDCLPRHSASKTHLPGRQRAAGPRRHELARIEKMIPKRPAPDHFNNAMSNTPSHRCLQRGEVQTWVKPQ